MMIDLAEAGLLVDIDADVMTVTLNRPETRNSQTPQMWAAFTQICESVQLEVRFVVLRGVGEVFSSGLDRSLFDGSPAGESLVKIAQQPEAEVRAFIQKAQAGFACWRGIAPTTIAVVQGPAIGAGWQLAMSCDLVLAAPTATFSLREARLGLVPDLGATGRLLRAVGYQRAFEVCASGRDVSAAEAERWGLVNEVCSNLDQSLAALLDGLRNIPEKAVSEVKRLLVAVEEGASSWTAEQDSQIRRLSDLLSSHDRNTH
jgi:enoyl-CoA hydratase/carnithine racemase